MGDLLGRRARPRRDRRGLRGPAHGRPLCRGPSPRRCASASSRSREGSAPRGSSRASGSRSSVSGPGRRSRRSRPSSSCCEPEAPLSRLQLRLLGAADDGRALDRHALPPGSPPARGARSAARSTSGRSPRPQTAWNLARLVPALVQRPPDPAGPRARARLRGALADRPAGARRLLGRDSAAVGLVADRASPAVATGPSRRTFAAASRAGRGSWWTTASGSGPRRASRLYGTPAWRSSRSAPPALQRTIPALRKAGEWLLQEEVRARGDWAVSLPESSPAAGHSSTTTTCIRTSTTRRSSASRLERARRRRPAVARACRLD